MQSSVRMGLNKVSETHLIWELRPRMKHLSKVAIASFMDVFSMSSMSEYSGSVPCSRSKSLIYTMQTHQQHQQQPQQKPQQQQQPSSRLYNKVYLSMCATWSMSVRRVGTSNGLKASALAGSMGTHTRPNINTHVKTNQTSRRYYYYSIIHSSL